LRPEIRRHRRASANGNENNDHHAAQLGVEGITQNEASHDCVELIAYPLIKNFPAFIENNPIFPRLIVLFYSFLMPSKKLCPLSVRMDRRVIGIS
jgi:hypothetical protein